MAFRIGCIVILLISTVSFPLYVTIPIAAFCLYFFPNFYELIPVFFVNDVLYGVTEMRYFGFSYLMTLLALIAVLVSVRLHEQVFPTNVFNK